MTQYAIKLDGIGFENHQVESDNNIYLFIFQYNTQHPLGLYANKFISRALIYFFPFYTNKVQVAS